jgi:hypothetical protein
MGLGPFGRGFFGGDTSIILGLRGGLAAMASGFATSAAAGGGGGAGGV